MELQRLMFMN